MSRDFYLIISVRTTLHWSSSCYEVSGIWLAFLLYHSVSYKEIIQKKTKSTRIYGQNAFILWSSSKFHLWSVACYSTVLSVDIDINPGSVFNYISIFCAFPFTQCVVRWLRETRRKIYHACFWNFTTFFLICT